MKRRGWTLLEVMVAGGLLLLLLSWSSMALISFSRTLRGLQKEGDQIARAGHALENLQREILQSKPLPPGTYTLGAEPLRLEQISGQPLSLTCLNATVVWQGRVQGPAEKVTLRVWESEGHNYVAIDWHLASPLPTLKSVFDSTVRL